MTTQPKWSTPTRKAILVSLFLKSGGFCTLGHNPCRGSWQVSTRVACTYGTPCDKPQAGRPCRYQSLTPDGMPARECKLVTIRRERWHCAYSPGLACFQPFDCHYELAADRLVKEWQAVDRVQTGLDRQAEWQAMHGLGETSTPLRGRFSNIARDIFAGKQPLYYLESLGMNGLTCKPFARVKLASSYMRLYVNLGDSLRPVSKNAKRKALRYGRPLPASVSETISAKVSLAVRDYLSH